MGAFVEKVAGRVDTLGLGSYHYQRPSRVEDTVAYYGVSCVLGALVACINQADLLLGSMC